MARVLRVPVEQVSALQTRDEGRKVVIHYIERDFAATGEAKPGVIELGKKG